MNYERLYNQPNQKEQSYLEHHTEEEHTTQGDPETDTLKFGLVTGCSKLNVRKEPKKDAEILGVVEKNAELMIDDNESTQDYYKVYTQSGAEGFCSRKFINAK